MERRRPTPNTPATTASGAPATDGRSPSLWFGAPTDDQDRRPQLTRERVVEEALAVIAHDGAQALTMRRLAARLGVVPGALYHHVRNKQQLQDLLLDGVLAEVDLDLDPSLGWTEQLKVLAHRLRQVLEAHPGVAGILKTRDPLGPPLPGPGRGLPVPAADGRVRRSRSRPGLLPAAGLHHRFCRQHSCHLGQRAARPRPSHQNPAAPVLPIAAP